MTKREIPRKQDMKTRHDFILRKAYSPGKVKVSYWTEIRLLSEVIIKINQSINK